MSDSTSRIFSSVLYVAQRFREEVPGGATGSPPEKEREREREREKYLRFLRVLAPLVP